MFTLNQLKSNLEESESVKTVAQTLGEIAALQLKLTRGDVSQNTLFFNEIAQVYHQLRVVSARRAFIFKKPLPQSAKNARAVSVLLTSNSHFYGGLDQNLTQAFIKTSGQYPTDRITIGKFASDYLKDVKFDKPYTPIIFADDKPSLAELSNLINQTFNYSKILIYHSKFVTVLKQEPEVSDISQTVDPNEVMQSEFDYIVEPELPKMLKFFEAQMLTLLYKAIFLESALSKTAARMISMYEAENNADKIVSDQKRELFRLERSIDNSRILETYAGIKMLFEPLSSSINI